VVFGVIVHVTGHITSRVTYKVYTGRACLFPDWEIFLYFYFFSKIQQLEYSYVVLAFVFIDPVAGAFSGYSG